MIHDRDDLDKFFDFINRTLLTYDSNPFSKYFKSIYNAGSNNIYQKNISETKKFDAEWISTVESYFPSIDTITRNPKSSLQYEDEIVDVNRAKKINAASVRHLASHTHLIKEIKDDGMVIPKKILTTSSDIEYGIYENRFVATLINRLFLFVRNRLLIIRENVESFQKDHVFVDSNFEIDEANVNLKIDLTIKKDLDDPSVNVENYELLERAERLEGLIEGLKRSYFMTLLENTSPVRPPIMKTNIILKNPDFRNAYNLWLFLDKYSSLAFDVSVKEKAIPFDDSFADHLRNLALINFATIVGNQKVRNDLFNIRENYKEYTKKSYKQLKNNADDFVDDPGVIQIEDTTLNEYFLEKYKKLLQQSADEIEIEGKVSSEEALKRALRKTTEIINGLYNSIFEFETEQNFFDYLRNEDEDERVYEKKLYQVKFAKVIREIKEVDYNNSMRRERKLLRELETINKSIIKIKQAEISRYEDSSQRVDSLKNDIEKRKQDIIAFKASLDDISDNKSLLDYEKDAIEAERLEVTQEVKNNLDQYRKEYREKLALEKEKLQTELKELNQALKETQTELKQAQKLRQAYIKEILAKQAQEAKAQEALEKKRIKEEAERERKRQLDALKALITSQKAKLRSLSEELKQVNKELDTIKVEQ